MSFSDFERLLKLMGELGFDNEMSLLIGVGTGTSVIRA
jgi:hypothetical protein